MTAFFNLQARDHAVSCRSTREHVCTPPRSKVWLRSCFSKGRTFLRVHNNSDLFNFFYFSDCYTLIQCIRCSLRIAYIPHKCRIFHEMVPHIPKTNSAFFEKFFRVFPGGQKHACTHILFGGPTFLQELCCGLCFSDTQLQPKLHSVTASKILANCGHKCTECMKTTH